MKTCPVCQSVAFDDAETCFGCMHRFGEDGDILPEEGAEENALPVFSIRFTPEIEITGGVKWNCAVEMA